MQKKYYVLISFLFLVGLLLFLLVRQPLTLQRDLTQYFTPKVEQTIPTSSLSPTPFPFQEYTIPYLRERAYASEIGELRPLSTNNEFISYLTRYDSDSLQINALLTKPAGANNEQKAPAIVFIHGYIPPTLYKTQERYQTYIDYFCAPGFCGFQNRSERSRKFRGGGKWRVLL